MLSGEDWAEIRRLHRSERLPIKMIARVLGVSRNTVRAALASEGPPKYQRAPVGSVVDEVEPRIPELLQAYPTMPATVIAQRIGWRRSIRVLSARVADPEAKGLIERAQDYLERSFLPGRTFTGPADFNTQLQSWLELVNGRVRRALGCAPTDRIVADRAAMLTLPPVAPVTGWRSRPDWAAITTSGWTATTTRIIRR